MEDVSLESLASDIQKLSDINAAMGFKDRYTQGHAHRVALYSVRLARRIGLSAEEAGHIGIGGLLHDIGKLGLSDRIFSHRTTRLYGDLLDEVRRHPDMGVAILSNIDSLAPVLDLVRLHHERLDGSGYPYGLTADDIPLGARIIAVADCFDAITTDRPYQNGKSRDEAFAILNRMGERELCRDLVEAFISDIEEDGMIDAKLSV